MQEKEKMFIYADNAATTNPSEKVIATIIPLFSKYGNPSSSYSIGYEAKKLINQSRETIAQCLNCKPNEIYFTSGGSEADNWAIKSVAEIGLKTGKKHIISSKFEHHAVLHSLKHLEEQGFEITLVDISKDGFVNPNDIKKAIRDDTIFVSIMTVNNEIGTIQPIKEISEICHKNNIIFHTDGVQAIGQIPIDLKDIDCDMMSMSAHKFHGLKGTGALYIREGIKISNLIDGGNQENGLRAGTENVIGIVAMSTALKEKNDYIGSPFSNRIKCARNQLLDCLMKIPYSQINGSMKNRVLNNINMSFKGIEGESLVLALDSIGICISSGSACNSHSLEPSHVLKAIGVDDDMIYGSLRITLGENIMEENIKYMCDTIPVVIKTLRSMSPVLESKYK